MVSTSCLEEINRLRSLYRKDLPQYEITESSKRGTKRTYNIALDDEAPLLKKPCKIVPPSKPLKRKATSTVPKRPAKKAKVSIADDDDAACLITDVENAHQRTEWMDLRYCPVNEEWQRDVCETLGLQYRRAFQHQDGGPDTILTRPDCRTLRKIVGDGNCLFRSLSYIITGSEDQHFMYSTCFPFLIC